MQNQSMFGLVYHWQFKLVDNSMAENKTTSVFFHIKDCVEICLNQGLNAKDRDSLVQNLSNPVLVIQGGEHIPNTVTFNFTQVRMGLVR